MKPATLLKTCLLPILLSQALLAQPSRVEKRSFFSNALGLSKNYYVYLPEGYDISTERYPVAYFLRGHEFEWLDPALPGRVGGRNLKAVADDLFSAGQIGKMIIVCPSTASEDYNNSVHSCGVNMLKPNLRAAEGIGTGRFEDYFVQDLIPHSDATLRTIADREHRAIDGFSLGGYSSTTLSLRHADLFISVGSYDGTIMWYNLDDTTIPGTNPDDRNWLDPYFDPVYNLPRNVPYMLLHSASNILRAADASQLDDFRTIRFHISMTPSDNVGNHSNNRQLISIFAEKGIRNSFSNPIVAPNAVHDYGFADMHAATSLVRHWQAFAGHKLNAPLSLDFGGVAVGESDTSEVWTFNYGDLPLTLSSTTNVSPDIDLIHLSALPQTLAGKYDTLNFRVIFSPSAHNTLSDTVSIVTDDNANPKTRVALRGRGFLIGQAQVGSAYTANSATTSQLFSLDRQTGVATPIAATGAAAIRGLAIHPITKELYATVPNPSMTSLYRLSSQYGEALLLATIPAGQIRGIAFQLDGTLFGVSATGRFYKIIPATGEATQIGSTSAGVLYSGLSLNPKTGKLYASHVAQDRIYTIDSNTAQATLVGSTGLGGNNPALAFGPDGALYGVTSTNNFIRIDSTNAAGTVIGPTGVTGLSALAMRTDSLAVGVADRYDPNLVESYNLSQNYPNPFNPETTIEYQVPRPGRVKVAVYNLAGQLVRTLFDAQQPAGRFKLNWEGKDDRGLSVASGVYLYQLQAGEFSATKKMILMR